LDLPVGLLFSESPRTATLDKSRLAIAATVCDSVRRAC
jgi:hypothetical protein